LKSDYHRSAPRVSIVSETGGAGGGRVATGRSARDERAYVSIVIAFLAATTAISIYDMYLLLTLMAP
jgi:hypothetical protein